MTEAEYRRRRENYQSSSAPIDVKEKAINKLDAEYWGSSLNPEAYKKIVQDIEEGLADTDDMR